MAMQNNQPVKRTPNRSFNQPSMEDNQIGSQSQYPSMPPKQGFGPYGMQFGEENKVKQREQQQYREDLDYLVNLRRRHGEMSQKEWEEYNRKLNYMNDRYAYGELDKRNFLRGMNKGYEDEIQYRKEQERLRKQNEYENERKQFEGMQNQELIENERRQEQKHKLYNDQLNDLDNYYRRKDMDNKLKNAEGQANLRLIDEENRILYGPSNQYHNKMNDINRKMYNKIYKFNDCVGEPINQDAFTAKNDFEFNKKIADQRKKEKDAKRFDPNEIERLRLEMENQKALDNLSHKDKNKNQKLYHEYLDNQNRMNSLNKMSQPKDFGPQLLMPAYLYPNRPIPLNKKAKDSLVFSKDSNKIFDNDMNRFFNWDSQFYTMMDYGSNGKNLGDSMLRHNPITCPVNDYYHNRYVNNLKKRSEFVPHTSHGYQEQGPRNLASSGEMVIR